MTTLGLVAAKIALLVALAAFASRLLRRSSAATRHSLWTAILVGVVLLALSPALSSGWSIAIPLPDAIASVTVPLSADSPALDPSGGLERATSMPDAPSVWILVWLAGVLVLAARFVAGRVALSRLLARGRTIEQLSPPGLLRRVRWVETDELAVPATWGTLRPVIALPASTRTWPAPRRLAALRHELAHVRRLDALTRTVADVACVGLWFHPAVWLVARRMRAESERACDDAVLRAGDPPVEYAELLLALARSASHRRAVHAMADKRELEGRLRAILDPTTLRSGSRAAALLASAGAILVATVLGATELRAALDLAPASIDEQVPMTEAAERQALERSFRPHDAREAAVFASLRAATRHVKQHERDLVRERATWALSIADDDRVVAPLIAALASDDWRIRAYAATELTIVDTREATDALLERLADPAWRVRAAAASALAHCADARAFAPMRALLDDPAWQVRFAAVEYLAGTRSAEALDALRARTTDPHVAVRSAATAALSD
jgi:beta-lactamase regulating signal transducer with metallopeptidase domain